ncbi:glycoside hydrolase family 19 protein [Dysgonomonas sp. 520]|uniref:glycoside hydrolase family 19 protein n=1 Tax=Dysgonomonas sp. 520 TaxID=2302931 RepID=UPI0013D8362C|nr:glycoside hydrolase family 19 protein [Dysgonomonas sp. 520]NDW11245.1 glycoside hydrolase family 19 protein [Dysgonomonas sp. 520]
MEITLEQLQAIYPSSTAINREKYIEYLNQYMNYYEINTPNRICMFLAQIGHESGQLKYNEELASGAAYEGRKDLGNTHTGDGRKYKGRGLIQITGRANYKQLSDAWGIDFINQPELLATPEFAVKSACWWWNNRKLNTIADNGDETAFKRITKIINGGYNGYADRLNIWNRCKKISTIS